MKPRLNNQTQENPSRHNSDLSEEQKTDRYSTRLSSKVSSFSLFGCCWKGLDTPSTVSMTKKLKGRPTTFMGAQTTLTPHLPHAKQNNREGSYIGTDRSYIEQESFSRAYPMDIVFILGTKDKIVAKITFVKVSKSVSIMEAGRRELKAMNGSVKEPLNRQGSGGNNEVRPRSQSISDKAVPKKMKKEIFSKFDKGIKAEEWLDITPEKVAKHIANRLRCDTIVDALCGFGGNAIQFAKTCNFVIGIDIQNTKTLWAKHNAKIYGIDHKIDFINGDFTKIRNLTGDVVFLGPTVDHSKSGKPFTLFENIKPDPLTLLAKSLQVSYKIAIQLPGDTQLEELPQIFHQSLDKYDQYSKRFCIEIEKVLNTFGETECIIVYFGDCSSINQREEYEAIYEYISNQESPQWKREFPLPVVTAIIEKVGIRRSFKYLSEAEDKICLDSPSLFGIFLHRLREENILSQTALNKIIEEESRRHEWSGFSGPNSYYGASLRTNQDLSQNNSLRIEPLSRHSSKVTGLGESQEKPRGLLSKLVSDPKGGKIYSSLTEQFSKPRSPTLTKGQDDSKFGYSPVSPPSMLENMTGTLKNSHDVSELAVSSYSVSSDYLRDSSEEDNISRQLTGEMFDDASPRASSVIAKDKVPNRDSVQTEGGRRKNRAISQHKRQFEVDGFMRKDRKESENRSFLLQCGDEF